MATREEVAIEEKEAEVSAKIIDKAGIGTSSMEEEVEEAIRETRTTMTMEEITDSRIKMASKMLMVMEVIGRDMLGLPMVLTKLKLTINRITDCITKKIRNSSSE